MRVCFFTLGSRGDVQPYIALAKELIYNNHSAIICTGKSFDSFIQENGVEFAEIPSDLMALLNTEIGEKIFNNPLKNAKLLIETVNTTINPNYRKSLDVFYKVAKDCDIIIYHPKALGAVDIAQKLAIPCVSMPTVPATVPIYDFPNLALFPTQNFGGFLNKLTYQINAKAEQSQIKIINDFRVNTLNLPPRKAGLFTFQFNGENIPTIYPISKIILQNNLSLGFCFLDSNNTNLNQEITSFIDNCKPIIVTFSSMPIQNKKKFIIALENALEITQNKAIVLTGDNELNFSSNQVLTLKKYPHDVLFKSAKIVIHHGGAGTTATALKSGIPQIIIPFSVDQPFWAKRMFKLGCSARPIRKNNINKNSLVKAITQASKESILNNCQLVQKEILKENGNKNCVTFLEQFTKKN